MPPPARRSVSGQRPRGGRGSSPSGSAAVHGGARVPAARPCLPVLRDSHLLEEPPQGLHTGSASYGPILKAAAVLQAAYGNVLPSVGFAVSAGSDPLGLLKHQNRVETLRFSHLMVWARALDTCLSLRLSN